MNLLKTVGATALVTIAGFKKLKKKDLCLILSL